MKSLYNIFMTIKPQLMMKLGCFIKLTFYLEHYAQLYIIFLNMCFIKSVLKTVNQIPTISKNDFFDTESIQSPTWKQDSFFTQEDFHTQTKDFENKINIEPKLNYNQILLNMIGGLNRNSNSISFLHMAIQNSSQKLANLFESLSSFEVAQNDKSSQGFQSNSSKNIDELSQSKMHKPSENELVKTLFGQKSYRYRLMLAEEFPNIIYKQRNINIKVKLVNLDGKIVKNANMINLCLGVSDDNGLWINTNRVGDQMLKGKTQVELYHGVTQFNKIYSKDISRTFANGKINFVVYTKPTTLIYNGLSSQIQENFDCDLIEPLVINDITIKAKKKN